MTTKQKYKAVAQAIRQALSRLVDVEKGCIVKALHNSNKGVIVDMEICLGLDDILSYGVLLPNGEIKELKYLTLSEFEIIGKEPMLNDVLEWFSKIDKPFRGIMIDENGFISRVNFDFTMEVNGLKWDLSQPYLKDQSEELINFLYELIKE